jgi:hypothetical protein
MDATQQRLRAAITLTTMMRKSPLERRSRRLPWSSLLWAALLLATAAAAQTSRPAAEMTGGPDDTGQWFEWRLSNNSLSPIVAIEIPHYQADLMELPPGWSFRWLEASAPEARRGRAWMFATAARPEAGVRPGSTVDVRMRIRHGGVQTGRDSVRVRFADGRDYEIANVNTPREPGAMERYSTTFGFGLIVLIIALAARRRRRRAAAPTAEDGAEERA